jgi:hypothetical protein
LTKDHKTGRRILATLLITAWIVVIVYAVYFVKTPTHEKFVNCTGCEYLILNGSQLPIVVANVTLHFNYTGSFSANNPMAVSVAVGGPTLHTSGPGPNNTTLQSGLKSVSDTQFRQFYVGFAFQEADGSESAGIIPFTGTLTVNGETYYIGSAKITFDTEGGVYTWLDAAGSQSVPAPMGYEDKPLFTISSASDTYAWQYGQEATQLSWIIIAFSVLLLQPLAEAILGWKEN